MDKISYIQVSRIDVMTKKINQPVYLISYENGKFEPRYSDDKIIRDFIGNAYRNRLVKFNKDNTIYYSNHDQME
jgi:hypothetical protein